MQHQHVSHAITWRLAWATLLACISTFQFGYHLSVFNAPQQILTCQASHPGPYPRYEESPWARWGRMQCLAMGATEMASINTAFTVGGLVSSLVMASKSVTERHGRRRLQMGATALFLAGSVTMALANSPHVLIWGRFLTGLAAGACMVVSPILINELTPFNHRGLLGSLVQFGVPIGILLAQLVAFPWSNDHQWRNLFVFGGAVACVQYALLFSTVELPKWLVLARGNVSGALDILHKLRSDKIATEGEINHWRSLSWREPPAVELSDESSALLGGSCALRKGSLDLSPVASRPRRGSVDPSDLTLLEYITSHPYRKECIAVILIMTAQQLSGMNAITFYGVSVASNIFPAEINVLWLTSALALTNVVASLLVSPLFDRWGRKPLLLISVASMALSAAVISAGLLLEWDYVAVSGCFSFIVGYSIGLGQLPFLMTCELASHESVALAQSLGTMFNWLANSAVAFLFPLLQGLFGDCVFFLFFALGSLFFVLIDWKVPETKDKLDYDHVWRGY